MDLRALSLLICIPMSGLGASISGGVSCTGVPQHAGSLSCSSSTASASSVFQTEKSLSGLALPDVWVNTAASNPSFANNIYPYAHAWLHYDAVFDLTVSGSGSGYVLPILLVDYTPEPAISSTATASIGPQTVTGQSGFGGGLNGTLIGGCYLYCAIPITFGVPTPVELKLDVEASTGFALFPPSVRSAGSIAEASLQDFYVFNEAKQRISGTVTFTETGTQVVTPEPSYTAPVLASLAFAGIWNMIGKRRWRSR
jgi:hypothetical protein